MEPDFENESQKYLAPIELCPLKWKQTKLSFLKPTEQKMTKIKCKTSQAVAKDKGENK